jgi:hypothetical protein
LKQIGTKENKMPNQAITDLTDEITEANTILDSAMVYVNGVPALIDAAVQAAIANGATAAELSPVRALGADLKTKAEAIRDAIVANTPPPGPTAGAR